MSESKTVYLITGANRGLGRAVAEVFVARPNTIVIGTVRDVDHSSAQSLLKVPTGEGSSVILQKLECVDLEGPAAVVEELTTKHNIGHLDVVIANAGISQDVTPIATVSLKEVRRHVDTNGFSVLALFQSTIPLLKKSKNNPRFVNIGSPIGAIGGMEHRSIYSLTSYGVSKAIGHYLTRRIHFDYPELVSFVIDPGFVQTDMGNAAAQGAGLEKAWTTVEDSRDGIVKLVDEATKEKSSGRFIAAGDFAGIDGGKDFPF